MGRKALSVIEQGIKIPIKKPLERVFFRYLSKT